MSPLKLGGSQQRVPTDFAELLRLLSSRPQPAVVHYSVGPGGAHMSRTPLGRVTAAITPEASPAGGGDETAQPERVELSGRVLANWATKLIGLFAEEYDLSPGDAVLVDMALHWKAAAVVLAAGAMGAQVQLTAPGGESSHVDAQLVVTDRPLEVIESAALGEAELAAVSPGLLDGSFAEATGEQIPAWVTDVSAEVRQYPDQLLVSLPAVELPQAAETSEAGPLVLTAWSSTSFSRMLDAWSTGGVVILFSGEPGDQGWELMRRNEGIA